MDYELIIDTKEHAIIKENIERSYRYKTVHQSLPFSIFNVRELRIPIIEDFETRVGLANKFMRLNYANINMEKGSPNIYLSRQGMKRRKVNNHAEVEKILRKWKYEIVSPEKEGLNKMFSIVNSAKRIVGPNGAAMCNTVLGKEGSLKVGIIYPDSHIDDYYYRVQQALKNTYYGICAEHVQYRRVEDSIMKYYYPSVGDDYSINIERLEMMLYEMNKDN